MISYWHWLFHGSGAGAGVRRFFDWWLALHALIGAAFACLLPMTLQTAGVSLLLPLAGVFIGLTFAWGGNAQALLQSSELTRLSSYRAGGYEEYLYTYQSAVLLILITLCLWGIAGLGLFDNVWPRDRTSTWYRAVVCVLFFFSSVTVRECWQVVVGSQAMLLARFKIQENDKKNEQDS